MARARYVFLPVLIVLAAGLVVLSGCRTEPGPGPVEPLPGITNPNVLVPPSMQSCNVDADCTYVETTCNHCCTRDAINKAYVDEYDAMYQKGCEGYNGPVCMCQAVKVRAYCESNRCMLEESPH